MKLLNADKYIYELNKLIKKYENYLILPIEKKELIMITGFLKDLKNLKEDVLNNKYEVE
jgi:hypothetical protein